MNDELTPAERAALRARIVGGAHDIKPAGAHRGAWIAGSVAAALVVAIAGGVAATSTLSAPPVATTPAPSATVTVRPVPEPTPTPAPTESAPALAFDGDCSKVLDDASVSGLVGQPMSRSRYGLFESSVTVLGGVSCDWAATGDSYEMLGVSVIPWAVVPDSVRDKVGIVPPCEGGFTCYYSERYGDALVTSWAQTNEMIQTAVREVGPRAASEPGERQTLPADAWAIPDCDSVRAAFSEVLTDEPLRPYQGDFFPAGVVWDVLTSADAAGWCGVTVGEGATTLSSVVDVNLAPGQQPDIARVLDRGGSPVTVAGAQSAWMVPPLVNGFASLVVSDGANWFSVETERLSHEQMVAVAEALLRRLD